MDAVVEAALAPLLAEAKQRDKKAREALKLNPPEPDADYAEEEEEEEEAEEEEEQVCSTRFNQSISRLRKLIHICTCAARRRRGT